MPTSTLRHLRTDPLDQLPVIDPGESVRRYDAYRTALLNMRAKLRGDWSQMSDAADVDFARDAEEMARDVVDRANVSIEQDLTLYLLGNAEDVLEKIDEALVRIDNGVYGLCEDCAAVIPEARLEAIPYASQCVRCAEKAERRRRPR